MRRVGMFFCGAYWLALTVLLLVPNPFALLGLTRLKGHGIPNRGVHFTAFLLLTLVTRGVQSKKARLWPVLVVLVLYAVATETLQLAVVGRTVELPDYFENLLGIAAGVLVSVLWRSRGEAKVER